MLHDSAPNSRPPNNMPARGPRLKKTATALAVGRAIRNQRVAAEISQEELAHRAGLHRTYIGAVERGERNITVRNLVRIASSLSVKASGLLEEAERER